MNDSYETMENHCDLDTIRYDTGYDTMHEWSKFENGKMRPQDMERYDMMDRAS